VLFLMISFSRSVIFRENFKVLQAFYQLNFLYLFMMLFLIAEGLLR